MRWPRLLHLKARSTVARLCVACLTLVVVVGIELGRQMGHPVPVPFLLMLAAYSSPRVCPVSSQACWRRSLPEHS